MHDKIGALAVAYSSSTFAPSDCALAGRAPPLTVAHGQSWDGLNELRRLGFVAQLCMSAESLEQALQQACRLSQIWCEARFAFETRSANVAIQWCQDERPSSGGPDPENAVEMVTAWLQLVACVAGPNASPVAVHAPHAAHESLRALVRCPIFDAADGLTVCFDRALARRPNPAADAHLYAALVRYADKRLLELVPAESTAERVRSALSQLDATDACACVVASRLGLGVRTLHRRLCAERTTFRKLLDDHRLERCMRELRATTSSAKQIAYTLGFADPASFHRAFKRWTGSTVRVVRARSSESARSE